MFGLSYVVMRKPEPIDTTTLNYNWQVWETNAFSIYTKETDEIDERSAQEAVAAVLRYLSRVGLLRYNCHSGYLSSVVQETEMANVLTPAGGIFRRFVEPGQEVEYGQKLDALLKTVFLVKNGLTECLRALCQSISFSGSVGHGKLVLFFLRLHSFRRLLR